MSKNVNKVILVGNVGQGPEVKYTASVPVAKPSLATCERFKDKIDAWQDTLTPKPIAVLGSGAGFKDESDCGSYQTIEPIRLMMDNLKLAWSRFWNLRLDVSG